MEDNPADVRLFQEALGQVAGHDVRLTEADRLQAALKQLEDNAFDVALVDLGLPDGEGLEIVRRVQAAAPHLPIVVLTGRDDSELALIAVREGAQDYLVKGRVDGQLLIRSMRYAIERKRNLEAVEQREQHFRRLIEKASDVIAVLDREWKLKFISPSVERALGYSAGELQHSDIRIAIHASDRKSAAEAFGWAVRHEGEPRTFETRMRHKDGRWRVFEVTARSLMNDRVVAGIVVNAHDITDLKEAAEELRNVNARLEAVIHNAPVAIAQLDLNGIVQEWSAGAERILGWTRAEAVGQLAPSVPVEARTDLLASIAKIRSGSPVEQEESRRLRKDGSVLDAKIWRAPLCDERGDVYAVIAMLVDVTEQKLLEDQFRHAQKMDAVGRLAGGVAHDFNNLLTVIAGYTQMAIKRLPESEPAAAEMAEVLSAAERAARLTRQLLALSRREIVAPVVLDINDVIAQVEKLLRRMVGDDIQVETRLKSPLPPVRVDRSQLELVLLNLAVNARDAMPGGGTLAIETGVQGKNVAIRVTDTGVGMEAETIPRIFEPFFTTKEAGKGTGLGLSTSYNVIRQHGGTINVESTVGAGSTFEVRLPSVDAPTTLAAISTSNRESGLGSETVLIVEDEPLVADVMRNALVSKGYTVHLASNLAEVLIVLARVPHIDLLLSDVVLSGARGPQVAAEILRQRPGLPVLFVSGYTDGTFNTTPLPVGAGFLAKPFTPEALAIKVREMLS